MIVRNYDHDHATLFTLNAETIPEATQLARLGLNRKKRITMTVYADRDTMRLTVHIPKRKTNKTNIIARQKPQRATRTAI